MPARKRQQTNAMLYTLIAFVGLFIFAAIFAVIYYVKAEEYRTKESALRRRLDEYATPAEQQNTGAIVGTKQGPSWLGTMIAHFDTAISMVTGAAPQNTSAQVKLANANTEIKKTLNLVHQYIGPAGTDPNTYGLKRVIEQLKTALDNSSAAGLALKDQLNELQQRYNEAMAATHEKEKILLDEKDRLQQQVNQITQDYNKLKVLLEKTTDQRVQLLLTQLNQEKTNLNELNQEMLRTQAQLELTEQKLRRAQQEVSMTKPPPDSNAPAYLADGKIILVDNLSKIVHLDIGYENHVYRGLTFSVYDKNAPIPKDGKPKAEIEVFDVQKNFSVARIINPNKRQPILTDDIVANLIWNSDRKNVFVIAGEFDLDNNGSIDLDATDKIKTLIGKWGGRVDDAISVDTDFFVLGRQPAPLKKPTFEQLEIDPQAMDKYENKQRKIDRYKKLQTQAQALWIPIFRYERFLYFIGYKEQIGRPGAF